MATEKTIEIPLDLLKEFYEDAIDDLERMSDEFGPWNSEPYFKQIEIYRKVYTILIEAGVKVGYVEDNNGWIKKINGN